MKSIYMRMDEWRPQALSVLRIVAALLFLQHGLAKLFGFPVPGPTLHGLLILAAFLESVGALLLLAGAYTRIVAFVLSGEMAFAYFMAHAPRAFYPIAHGGGGGELFCLIFFYTAFTGGGAWSISRIVRKRDEPAYKSCMSTP